MKALKALVVFMGILIVAGLAVLGWGLSNQSTKMGGAKPVTIAAEGSEFGAVEVPLPAGARIEQVFEAGGRVILRVAGTGPERLVVLDPNSGSVAGSFVMAPEAPR